MGELTFAYIMAQRDRTLIQRQTLKNAATPLLIDIDSLGMEGCLQDWDRTTRIACTTHENVDGCEIPLGPSVYRNMAFCQHNHTGNAAIGREMVKVAV